MKLYKREEIIQKLGLNPTRRSEFALLRILERLQSENLVGEERESTLKKLFRHYLEVQRIREGLRPGRDWSNIRQFRLRQAEMLVHWKSGENTTADGLQEIRELFHRGDRDAFDRLVDELIEHERKRPSIEQTRRGNIAKRSHPITDLIETIVRSNPKLSVSGLEEALRRESGPGHPVICDMDEDEIWPSDQKFKPLAVSGLKDQLMRAKRKIAEAG